jgi:DNA primase
MPPVDITKDVIAAIKGSFDAEKFITDNGGEIMFSNSHEIRSTCIFHNGVNQSSLSYSRGKGLFHCFGECRFSGDAIAAVAKIHNLKFVDAIRRAADYSSVDLSEGIKLVKATQCKVEDWEVASEAAYTVDAEKNEVLFSPLIVKAYQNRSKLLAKGYMKSRGFDKKIVDAFGLGYCDFNDTFKDRMIIPIWDEDGNAIGYSGRLLTSSGGSEKYRIRKGFKKKYALYNLNNAKKYLGPKDPLVITEGFGQTWRLLQAGVPTGVAIMGSSISEPQKILILKSSLSIVLALDFDAPGLEATKDAIHKLEDYVDIKVVTHPLFETDQDLADLSVDTVRAMYASAVSSEEWLDKYESWMTSYCNEKEVAV